MLAGRTMTFCHILLSLKIERTAQTPFTELADHNTSLNCPNATTYAKNLSRAQKV
jgi:hypothetical protein